MKDLKSICGAHFEQLGYFNIFGEHVLFFICWSTFFNLKTFFKTLKLYTVFRNIGSKAPFKLANRFTNCLTTELRRLCCKF